MNNKGWIKLHRDILDSSVNSKPHLAWLFTVLLLNAAHEEVEFIFNGEKQTLKPGQLITGLIKLGQQALLTIQQVRSGLSALKSTSRITIKTTNKYSLITICNWGSYQQDNKQNNKPVTNQQQTNNKPATTYNKDKEVKKDTIHEILKAFNSISKNYKTLPEKNLAHWLTIYSVEEIKRAIQFIPLNDFWSDKMDNIILFRQRNPDGEEVDHIGKLLNTPAPRKIEKESLTSYRERHFKWQALQVDKKS